MKKESIENRIISVLLKYKIQRIGVFGSFARNENDSKSDIDLLVSFVDVPSLLQLIKIEREISEATGYQIDLLTENAIKNDKLGRSISKDLKIIYHA